MRSRRTIKPNTSQTNQKEAWKGFIILFILQAISMFVQSSGRGKGMSKVNEGTAGNVRRKRAASNRRDSTNQPGTSSSGAARRQNSPTGVTQDAVQRSMTRTRSQTGTIGIPRRQRPQQLQKVQRKYTEGKDVYRKQYEHLELTPSQQIQTYNSLYEDMIRATIKQESNQFLFAADKLLEAVNRFENREGGIEALNQNPDVQFAYSPILLKGLIAAKYKQIKAGRSKSFLTYDQLEETSRRISEIYNRQNFKQLLEKQSKIDGRFAKILNNLSEQSVARLQNRLGIDLSSFHFKLKLHNLPSTEKIRMSQLANYVEKLALKISNLKQAQKLQIYSDIYLSMNELSDQAFRYLMYHPKIDFESIFRVTLKAKIYQQTRSQKESKSPKERKKIITGLRRIYEGITPKKGAVAKVDREGTFAELQMMEDLSSIISPIFQASQRQRTQLITRFRLKFASNFKMFSKSKSPMLEIYRAISTWDSSLINPIARSQGETKQIVYLNLVNQLIKIIVQKQPVRELVAKIVLYELLTDIPKPFIRQIEKTIEYSLQKTTQLLKTQPMGYLTLQTMTHNPFFQLAVTQNMIKDTGQHTNYEKYTAINKEIKNLQDSNIDPSPLTGQNAASTITSLQEVLKTNSVFNEYGKTVQLTQTTLQYAKQIQSMQTNQKKQKSIKDLNILRKTIKKRLFLHGEEELQMMNENKRIIAVLRVLKIIGSQYDIVTLRNKRLALQKPQQEQKNDQQGATLTTEDIKKPTQPKEKREITQMQPTQQERPAQDKPKEKGEMSPKLAVETPQTKPIKPTQGTPKQKQMLPPKQKLIKSKDERLREPFFPRILQKQEIFPYSVKPVLDSLEMIAQHIQDRKALIYNEPHPIDIITLKDLFNRATDEVKQQFLEAPIAKNIIEIIIQGNYRHLLTDLHQIPPLMLENWQLQSALSIAASGLLQSNQKDKINECVYRVKMAAHEILELVSKSKGCYLTLRQWHILTSMDSLKIQKLDTDAQKSIALNLILMYQFQTYLSCIPSNQHYKTIIPKMLDESYSPIGIRSAIEAYRELQIKSTKYSLFQFINLPQNKESMGQGQSPSVSEPFQVANLEQHYDFHFIEVAERFKAQNKVQLKPLDAKGKLTQKIDATINLIKDFIVFTDDKTTSTAKSLLKTLQSQPSSPASCLKVLGCNAWAVQNELLQLLPKKKKEIKRLFKDIQK